jgi:ubiquinone/menaquinone biosynthesis C-methylase UbiE
MARTNQKCAAWVIDLLAIQRNDKVLEVGFGPGVGIQLLAALASAGCVAGVDRSGEMVEQAAARNASAIQNGLVDLRHGSVENLPFDDSTFDKAFAINSMQIWPDATRGLQEMRRVMRSGGKVALGFTPYSGQPNRGLTEMLTAAGFTQAHVVESDEGFCALAINPELWNHSKVVGSLRDYGHARPFETPAKAMGEMSAVRPREVSDRAGRGAA